MFWKRKKKVDPSKPPVFLLAEGPEGYCHYCAQDGAGQPLPYPPILIPTKPMWVASSSKWRWDYRRVCVKHAKKIMRKIKERDLDPLEQS